MDRLALALVSAAGLLLTTACAEGPTAPDGATVVEAPSAAKVVSLGDLSRVNGGGKIVDGANKITFGGFVEGTETELSVQFHQVSAAAVSGGTFHATGVRQGINFFQGDSPQCVWAMNVAVDGTFNGEAGWWLMYRAGDAGKGKGAGPYDTVRFELYGPGGKAYDTFGPDFTAESNCVGTARTGLDAGNVMIH